MEEKLTEQSSAEKYWGSGGKLDEDSVKKAMVILSKIAKSLLFQ